MGEPEQALGAFGHHGQQQTLRTTAESHCTEAKHCTPPMARKLRTGTLLGGFLWSVLVYSVRANIFPEGST